LIGHSDYINFFKRNQSVKAEKDFFVEKPLFIASIDNLWYNGHNISDMEQEARA
jgi:hypothetical protein